jgi:hypothetical protein
MEGLNVKLRTTFGWFSTRCLSILFPVWPEVPSKHDESNPEYKENNSLQQVEDVG